MDQGSYETTAEQLPRRPFLRCQPFFHTLHSSPRWDELCWVKSASLIFSVHSFPCRVSTTCRWSAPGLSKPSFEEAMKQKFKTAKKVCFSSRLVELHLSHGRATHLVHLVSVSRCQGIFLLKSVLIGVSCVCAPLPRPCLTPSQTNHWWKVSVTIPEYLKKYERVQCTAEFCFP